MGTAQRAAQRGGEAHHDLPPPCTLRSVRLATPWSRSANPSWGSFLGSGCEPCGRGLPSIVAALGPINQLNSWCISVLSRRCTRKVPRRCVQAAQGLRPGCGPAPGSKRCCGPRRRRSCFRGPAGRFRASPWPQAQPSEAPATGGANEHQCQQELLHRPSHQPSMNSSNAVRSRGSTAMSSCSSHRPRSASSRTNAGAA